MYVIALILLYYKTKHFMSSESFVSKIVTLNSFPINRMSIKFDFD